MSRFPKLFALGLFTTILLFATIASAAEPTNLLSNGGFEQGLAGWTADVGQSLVSDAAESHSGDACLQGKIDGSNQALTLRRNVEVRAGNLYRFEAWVRATNRTKLVLWATLPGGKPRQMIESFENLPGRWRRISTPIQISVDGTLKLEIVAPSSYGAPAGRIWVDDIALYETRLPTLVSISEGIGFNDEPTIAAADGSIYAAWVSYRDGADSLQLARFAMEGDSLRRVGSWQVAGGPGTYVLGPRLVTTGANVALVYAAERDRNWDIHTVSCDGAGPSEPRAVTSHEAVDAKPSAAWFDGKLHLAWESNRDGFRRIYTTTVNGSQTETPEAVSPSETSAYDPSIAVTTNGQASVAWHDFRDGNYDVYLRGRNAGGSWRPETRVTEAPSIDRHVVLFARGKELWLLYENARTEEYNIGRTNRRHLVVGQMTPTGLLVPEMEGANSPLRGRCEGASAAFDDLGRLWLAYLTPRLPRSGWDTVVTCWADGRWQPPRPLAMRKGMDRAPGLAIHRGQVVVGFQTDDAPQSWSDLDNMATATSQVLLASVDPNTMPIDPSLELVPNVESDEPFEAAALRVDRGEETPTPTIEYQGKTLNLLFGDLHEHTDLSVCNRLGDQSINESYQHMRDLARHDFACVTDHGYNLNPYLWGYTAKWARIQNDPEHFLAFLGEEWTSSFEEYSEEHPYGFYGHHNLILADPYFPRWWNSRNRQTPADLWEDLRKMNADFAVIPHQIADTGNVPTAWDYTDETAQPVAEIFQTRGSYEYKGTPREAPQSTPQPGYFLQDAWARGIVIGVIAAPDHGGGYGKACVYATERTRESVLEGIRARHCYGTTAAKIILDVRVDGHLMGEKITEPAGDSVEVSISVRCPMPIGRVEVCRNNRFIYTSSPDGKQAELTFVDRAPLEGRSYYYVRVIQEDEEIAWSSPVWFGAE